MRKLSATMTVLACGAIIGLGYQTGAQFAPAILVANPKQTSTTTTLPTSSQSQAPTATPPSSNPTATQAPTPVVVAPPANTTIAGDLVDTRFGTVQVQVTYSGNTITDVVATKLTDRDGRSASISNRAAPILRDEVLKAQSASVSTVSGATYTTEGYLSSLQSAIDKHV